MVALSKLGKVLTQAEALDILRHTHGPACLVEPCAGRIIAANGPACLLFGFDPDDDQLCLDAEMPALVTLRNLALEAQAFDPDACSLVFGTPEGLREFTCQVQRVLERGSNPVLLIVMSKVESELPAIEPSTEHVDDAATLREIARRIREGIAARSESSGVPEMADPSPRVEAMTSASEPEIFDERDPVPETKPAAESPVNAPKRTSQPQSGDQHDLRAAYSAKAEDLARLAHELRTPLSAIAAAAEIMKDERLGPLENERYKGYASDIYDGAQHALAVIGRLLSDGSRTKSGEDGSVNAIADLNSIVRSCISATQPLAEKTGLTIVSDLETDLPNLAADPVAIRQIILNLLTNSLKFCPRGAEIRVVTSRSKNGVITLEVADTGKGMSARVISDVMSPLRPRAAKPDEKGGMGLGLPLVRSLVEANHGTFNITSTPGRGTKVAIGFPRRRFVAV